MFVIFAKAEIQTWNDPEPIADTGKLNYGKTPNFTNLKYY